MAATRKVPEIPARLDGAFVPTRVVLWEATSGHYPRCAICEQPIGHGDLFTKAKAPGYGRVNVVQCRACRPFTVLLSDMRSATKREP